MNPELLQGIAALAAALVSMIGSVVLPIVALKVRQYTGIKIEEKHMRALHEAAQTWAETAVLEGPREATREAGESLREYLLESVPDAFTALAPASGTLAKLAGRYLKKL